MTNPRNLLIMRRQITGGVTLTTASDVAAALAANPEGTVFTFQAGTYRNPVQAGWQPKNGQKCRGQLGAILKGSKLLTGWTVSGSQWWASAFLPGAYNGHGECLADGADGLCAHRQWVFRDGAPLTRVASAVAATAGKFFTDYAANRVYVGDDPSGHTIEQAWNNWMFTGSGNDVEVSNFVIEQCANDAQHGAIEPTGTAARWYVFRNEVRYNHGGAVHLGGSGGFHRLERNKVHHNGQMGITGNYTGNVVTLNEISTNNVFGFDPGWEGGGTKFGDSLWYDAELSYNYVHDNTGAGLWLDINAGTTTIAYNDVRNHPDSGIQIEISYGQRPDGTGTTLVHHNTLYANDTAADTITGSDIMVAASPNIEVYENDCYGGSKGTIWFFQQARTDSPDPRGEHVIRNVYVHDNRVDMNGVNDGWRGKVGLWTDTGRTDIFGAGFNNRFLGNDYWHSSSGIDWFDWTVGFRTFSQWQSTYGWDTAASGGSLTVGSRTVPGAPSLSTGPI